MKVPVATLLGIHIAVQSREILLDEVKKYLDQSDKKLQKSLIIFTPNTEQLVLAQKNTEFANVRNQADIAIPDTGGVVWAGHMLTKNGPKQAIPGVEFLEDLAAIAANRHIPIGLIGGRGDTAIKTFECLRNKYHGLEGWAIKPESFHVTDIAKKIQRTGTKIVFVGLGAPKQEFFIEALSHQLSVARLVGAPAKRVRQSDSRKLKAEGCILMAVGGSFDIIANKLPRAPKFIRRLRVPFFQRKIGFEWMWRLILEPWRLRRQLSLVKFIFLVCYKKLASPRRG